MLRNTKKRAEDGILRPPEEIHFPDGTVYKCTEVKER